MLDEWQYHWNKLNSLIANLVADDKISEERAETVLDEAQARHSTLEVKAIIDEFTRAFAEKNR